MFVCGHGWLEKQTGGQADLAGMGWYWYWCFGTLGGEGKFDTAGGVALVAGHALQAAVVVQVAGAGRAHTVQLSMGELCAFYVYLDFLCRWWESDGFRESGGTDKKRKANNLIVTTQKNILYTTYVAITTENWKIKLFYRNFSLFSANCLKRCLSKSLHHVSHFANLQIFKKKKCCIFHCGFRVLIKVLHATEEYVWTFYLFIITKASIQLK